MKTTNMTYVWKHFYTMSKNIRRFITSNNKTCVSRKRSNDIFDGILYWLSSSNTNTTQEEARIKVNSFKTDKTCSRQALVKKEDLVPIQVNDEQLNVLTSNIQNILYKNIRQQSNNPLVIAVDGTYLTMKESFCKEGYSGNKNGESIESLVTGMFNITCNCPVGLHITMH